MKRIAIIGGGPGGLMAAHLLEQRSGRRRLITLFEASGRVGGKIVSRHFDAAPVPYEAGVAELYDYSQLGPDPLRELVSELGLPTVPMAGQTVILDDRIMSRRADIRRHFGQRTLRAIEGFQARERTLMSPARYYHMRLREGDETWANRSFASVLAEVPDATARQYLKVAASSDLATEPELTTGLYGLENCLMDLPEYLRLYSIRTGIERLPEALRATLTARVEVDRPVVRVEKNPDKTYRVTSRKKGELAAEDFDAVAVALPNPWLPLITWRGDRLETAMAKHHARYEAPAHYLRVAVLFERPFWRQLITDSYFRLDAFGGCCVYDEGMRYDVGRYGVLSWLLAGSPAMLLGNRDDATLVADVLASLPKRLAGGRELFLEGKVHRWIGSVSARPGRSLATDTPAQHRPDPRGHPGLVMIGDYLFDSTLNGALDSAGVATDLILRYLERQEVSG